MSLRDEVDNANRSAATHKAICASLTKENMRFREALEKLAKLGNGDRYGNSIGNVIAREALEWEEKP